MTRYLLGARVWLALGSFVSIIGCVRGVDATKVRCTTSDHCPSNYVCSAGKCVGHSAEGADAGDSGRPSDASLASETQPSDQADIRLDTTTPPSVPDAPLIDTGPADLPPADVPLPGTGGAGGEAGGVGGAAGSIGSGGIGGLAATGGIIGSGGLIGSGGIVATGGRTEAGGSAGGGVASTGGVVSTGGIVGSGGTITCQPKARDCTSSLDSNCNGTPDNQETTYCACAVGSSQGCQEHPGYDGKGICKAGSQTCSASSDKTTSSWGACSGAAAPSTRNCTSSADNDCNGTPDNQETAYCQCQVNATQPCLPPSMCTAGSQTCTANSDKTTTSWGPCTGYTSPSVMYRDSDGDGYGDPLNSNQVCPGTTGYVSNNEDCDDSSKMFHPGVAICGTVTQAKTCASGGHGVASTQTCDQGCMNGECRKDGTIGLPGYVTCLSAGFPRCLVGDGCKTDDGTCGVTNTSHFYCDGPNDCPGQDCWLIAVFGWLESKCQATKPEDSTVYKVCDPLASLCASPLTCTKYSNYYPIYVCQ